MHTTQQKILDYVKVYCPSIKMSDYLALFRSALSNVDYVDMYPVEKALITVTDTSLPTKLNFSFVAIKKIYATTATTLEGIPSAVNEVITQYDTEQDSVLFTAIGNYVIEYYYKPDIADENSDPKIPDSYINGIAENIISQYMMQFDKDKAMVWLQTSMANSLRAHLKENKKHKNANLKSVWGR